jgi:hypothetical protein
LTSGTGGDSDRRPLRLDVHDDVPDPRGGPPSPAGSSWSRSWSRACCSPSSFAGLTWATTAPRLQREYTKHLRLLHANDGDAADEPALHYDRQYTALRQAVLARKRAVVLRLRDQGRIDDTVLRQVQARLDIEEVRLSRREETE